LFHPIIKWLKARLPNSLKLKIKKVLGIGSSAHNVSAAVETDLETDIDKINIAVYTGGGLGDFIVYKAIFDSLLAHDKCRIYLFTISYANAETILSDTANLEIYYPRLRLKEKQFDLVFEIDHYINVRKCNAFELKRKSPKLYDLANRIITYNNAHIPTTDNIRAQRNVIIFRAKYFGLNRWTQLSCGGVFDMAGMRSGITVNENRVGVLDTHGLRGTKYITLSFGADVDMGGMRQTKVWPLYRYEEFLKLFKEKYPEIIVVQLATKKQPKIEGVDIFIRDYHFEDVKVILANSLVHVSNEGGLVHTATQLGTRCVVPFGPTPSHYYGYPENINIVSPVCSGCMEITEDWFLNCPSGFEKAECMSSITAEMVFDAVMSAI